MKHATFKDFVREVFYKGADAVFDVDFIEGTLTPESWREVQTKVLAKKFDEVDVLLKTLARSITIPGVVTFWPNEAQAAAAYLAQVAPPEPYDGRFNG